MENTNKSVYVYLEVGKKKTIAGAVEWPGWCRIGRSEEKALAALVDYGVRYSRVLAGNDVEFQPPGDISQLVVIERIEGDATTDFGAPSQIPMADRRPFLESDRCWFEGLLTACWQAFDEVVETAEGKTLQKGPRGGGRELEGILEHVLEGDRSYLSKLGRPFRRDKSVSLGTALKQCRVTILEGLDAAVRGEIAEEGPRGGLRWPARYFVRRVAWHTMDHLWEIEDRVQ